MKKYIITAPLMALIFFTSCSLQENKQRKNQEFNGLDKSSMDMIYYPDGFAYKKTFKDLNYKFLLLLPHHLRKLIFYRPTSKFF